MAATPFRPTVTALEDRLTPAISPTDVFNALNTSASVEKILQDLGPTVGSPRGLYAQQYLISILPALSAQADVAANVLGQFKFALQNQIATNPALTGFLAPYVDAVTQAEARARLNADYAILYTNGFRAGITGNVAAEFASTTNGTSGSNTNGTTETGSATDPSGVDTGSDTGTDTGTDTGSSSDPVSAELSTTIPDVNAPEWQTQASGLKIWDVVTGSGDLVQPGDMVTVDYIGWLTDGSEFDSSISRGEPSTFSLTGVIQGWQEGIPGMREGGIRRLYIPAALAYGNNPPTGSSIPPGADLVFEVKMLSVL